jgi:hypothetical protein
MGAWIEVGMLSGNFTSDLRRHADNVLRSMGKEGFLAGTVLMELPPGSWGTTAEEYRASALGELEMQLDTYENPEGITVLGGPQGKGRALSDVMNSGPLKEFRAQAAKIRGSLRKQNIRFLSGQTPDGCRCVGILVIEPTTRFESISSHRPSQADQSPNESVVRKALSLLLSAIITYFLVRYFWR